MSVVAKLAEKLVYVRLTYELESRSLLHPCQSGFRKGKCTLDTLLRLVGDVQRGFNKMPSHFTLAALVDLSRAFDKVNHHRLLLEFKKLGLPSCFVKWFLSFLTDRRYSVRFDVAVVFIMGYLKVVFVVLYCLLSTYTRCVSD